MDFSPRRLIFQGQESRWSTMAEFYPQQITVDIFDQAKQGHAYIIVLHLPETARSYFLGLDRTFHPQLLGPLSQTKLENF